MTSAERAVRRPWSMTARLISLQVLAVALLLGGALISLYYMISAHLEQDNRNELTNEARMLAHWVAATGLDQGRGAAPQIEHAQTMATLPIFVRIVGVDGTIRLENGVPLHVPQAIFPPPGAEAEAWRAPTGESFLLSSILLPAPPGRKGAVLEVAYDVSDDDTLLRHLRQRMVIVYGLTVTISALLAALIARGVFRPLAQLTAATARVQASQLHTRIGEAGWPAELSSLAREFDAMLHRLDDSFRRLARFSSDLSHELRNPINNLRGEAEVALNQARDPAEYRRVLESSLEECARLGRLIDTLLFIAKADHPAQGIRLRTLDGTAECRAVAEFFEATAAERNLTILVHGAGTVRGDPELLRRALANLVDNAARHTPAGGHIDLSVRAGAGPGTEVEVRDNGTGIAPEHLPRVFERFYRSEEHPGDADAASGFGLGLAIVKSIMDLHNGTVAIQSAPGSGTTVTLFFPATAGAS